MNSWDLRLRVLTGDGTLKRLIPGCLVINWKYKECLKPLGNEYDHYMDCGDSCTVYIVKN